MTATGNPALRALLETPIDEFEEIVAVERGFAERVAVFLEALAERWLYAPDVQPLQLLPPDPDRLDAGRHYAHDQLRRRGWTRGHVDALVDAVYTLRAEKDAADDVALAAYREFHAARQPTEDELSEVNAEAWNVKVAAHALLQDLIDEAEARVIDAIDAGVASALRFTGEAAR